MRYLPHTPEDERSMLETIGVDSLDALFSPVPDACRFHGRLDLPEGASEWEMNDHMAELAGTVAVVPEYKVYLGAGSYEHYVPASIRYLLGRSEFVTSYTPYQPEMSQGTLQAVYEYQTLVGRLLGMEVANASVYDGASALAEAVLMALRLTRRKKIAMSRLVHPHYREVVETYLGPTDFEIVELPYLEDGTTDLRPLDEIDGLAAVAIQSPNFFGCVENLQAAADKIHEKKGLAIAAFSEAMAFGLLKNPGGQGADIVCGEGQSLGVSQTFGGPGLGVFASRMKYVRQMPGRLVGKTADLDGKRGFVLTLSTREQHIRREKATSNICTNNSLCAVAAAMYMASAGATGFRQIARMNYDKAEHLKARLREAGCEIPFEAPTFNEFVVRFPGGFAKTHDRLLEKKIVAGLPLAAHYPDLDGCHLVCVTETKKREDLDALAEEIKAAAANGGQE